MTLDEEVLEETKAIRERLLETERSLEHLRADYHHAIRLLHARGGNMREIADALTLSHQRVHQIVGADDTQPEGPGGHRGHGGPGHPGPRRGFRGMSGRFTGESQEIVARASTEARELAHGSVEAPHLLLGLVEVDAAAAAAVDGSELRTKVAAAFPQGTERRRGRMRFGHTAKHTLSLAMQAAILRGEGRVEPRHIAEALTDPGTPREALEPLGVDLDRIRAAMGDAA